MASLQSLTMENSECAGESQQQHSLVGMGATVQLDGINYFVSPYPEKTPVLEHPEVVDIPSVFGLVPVTVVHATTSESFLDLTKVFSEWKSADDVFSDAFARLIYLSDRYTSYLHPLPHATIVRLKDDTTGAISQLPSGPYFLNISTHNFHKAYRLYADHAQSFTQSLLQTPNGTFQHLSAQVDVAAGLTIGVPSRIYSLPRTPEQPLAGLRIGVKDVFSLKGVRNTFGSRAYYELYPPSTHTAPAIHRLVAAGATIVGLQKTAQFAQGEAATADWVDFHAPFNPRGDGYDQPASSSAGGGTSVATYDWLDCSVGTDTAGSVRSPAGVNGIYGNRPTFGMGDGASGEKGLLDGVMPLAPSMDTIGVMARDPRIWDDVLGVLYGEDYKTCWEVCGGAPTTVYTIGFPTELTTPVEHVLDNFARKLTAFLAGRIEPLDIGARWEESAPTCVGGVSLEEYLRGTYAVLSGYEQTSMLRDKFYADYSAKHDGRRPFVNPLPLARWALADEITSEDVSRAQEVRATFATWFNEHILPQNKTALAPVTRETDGDAEEQHSEEPMNREVRHEASKEGDEESPQGPIKEQPQAQRNYPSRLLLHIITDPQPWHRNDYFPPSGPSLDANEFRMISFAGVPEYVVPVGEAPLLSPVTGLVEMFPVAVGIVGARGQDREMVRLVRELVVQGVLGVPGVGARMGCRVEGGAGGWIWG